MAERPPPGPRPLPGAPPAGARRGRLGVLRTFGWAAILGAGAAVGAVLGALDVSGWIIGLVVAAVTPALAVALRRSLP